MRIAHAWAIAWLDIYQTPAVVTESFTSEISGFFREIARGKEEYPHAALNPQTQKVNKLGRKRRYGNGKSRVFLFPGFF